MVVFMSVYFVFSAQFASRPAIIFFAWRKSAGNRSRVLWADAVVSVECCGLHGCVQDFDLLFMTSPWWTFVITGLFSGHKLYEQDLFS